MRQVLLPSVYFGSIHYYYLLVNHSPIVDIHSNYLRQTAANRCTIIGSEGLQNLIVPIQKHAYHTPVCQMRVSNDMDWKTQHLRAIKAAYGSAPFYEYYMDEIRSTLLGENQLLIDLNKSLQDCVLKMLEYEINVETTTAYVKNCEKWINDARNLLTAQKKNVTLPSELCTEYWQVFASKFGFVPNLSILDLLFNLGPEARIYLRNK